MSLLPRHRPASAARINEIVDALTAELVATGEQVTQRPLLAGSFRPQILVKTAERQVVVHLDSDHPGSSVHFGTVANLMQFADAAKATNALPCEIVLVSDGVLLKSLAAVAPNLHHVAVSDFSDMRAICRRALAEIGSVMRSPGVDGDAVALDDGPEL